jgi:CHAT domain-containing protein/tetratricopeptide (TPR) repeat protein
MSVLHLTLHHVDHSRVRLRYYFDNPNVFDERIAPASELTELKRLSKIVYDGERIEKCENSDKELMAVGRALYDWLDTPERILTGKIAACPRGPEPLVLAVAATAELKDLPWETLHDGAGFLVARESLPVIPVRWRDVITATIPAANRPLRALFMATAPEGASALEFEREEGAMLEATHAHPMALTVEESGNLAGLGERIRELGKGPDDKASAFDVFHITGHAGHAKNGEPIFLTESDIGERVDATAEMLREALNPMPRLLFLSGCRTAQSPGDALRSLAEAMLDKGAAAVLGWGRPVYDADGVAAARAFYGRLAVGASLANALAETYRTLRKEKAPHWHLLRLFVKGEMPGEFVTPPAAEGRAPDPTISYDELFLDWEGQMRVASRQGFIGRRRILQRCLKTLREAKRAGVIVHGMGGLGKSSLAARLCDRLGPKTTPVVIFGRLDEPTLIGKLCGKLADYPDLRKILIDRDDTLAMRLKRVLKRVTNERLVFVLDDFEQNCEGWADGRSPFEGETPRLTAEAAETLTALTEVVVDPDIARLKHRVIVTSRYALDGNAGARLEAFPLDGFRDADRRKLTARLQRELKLIGKAEYDWLKKTDRLTEELGARRVIPDELLDHAERIADGNPRLLDWLYKVVADAETDAEKILAALAGKRAEFLESVLAREILAQQTPQLRSWLAAALVYELPVGERELRAVCGEGDFAGLLRRAGALGLVETTTTQTERLHRAPRLLEELTLAERPADWMARCRTAAETLFEKSRNDWTESWATEILRLALLGDAKTIALAAADWLMRVWNDRHAYRQTERVGEDLLNRNWRSHATLRELAVAKRMLGDGARALALFDAALTEFPDIEKSDRVRTLYDFSSLLIQQGQPDRALRILQDEVAPFYAEIEDVRSRAVTLGKIANIWRAQGRLDDALRILQEELLPVFHLLGDDRNHAVTWGQIADVFQDQGQLDEALRIRREEQLPVFERLGDVRERAVTLGKIADAFQARGQ